MRIGVGKHANVHRPLYRLLGKFADCIKQCDDANPRDVAYWYGERSLTGLLAAAAWLMPDGWSLEEFTGERSKGKKPKVTPGRGDLWLQIGQRKFTVEAKVTWPEQLGNIERWKGRVETKLGRAFSQLSQLAKPYRYGVPLAVCYVVPAIPQSKWKADSTRFAHSMNQFLELMTENNSTTVALACWHSDSKKAPSLGPRGRKTVYPGVVTIFQWRNRWRFRSVSKR